MEDTVLRTFTGKKFTINRLGWHYAASPGGTKEVPIADEATGLNWLISIMEDRIADGYDCPFVVTGPRRFGKSVLAQKICYRLDSEFCPERIDFTLESFINGLQKLPPADAKLRRYPARLYDEGVTGFYNQEWFQQVPYIKILNIIGKKQLTMPILLPNLADLNPKVRSLVCFWAYLPQRGLAEIRFPSINQFDGTIFWDAQCCIKYGPKDDEQWRQYELAKDKFIDDYTREMGVFDGSNKRDVKVIEQRDRLMEHCISLGWMNQQDIADLFEVTQPNVSQMLTKYKSRKEKLLRMN